MTIEQPRSKRWTHRYVIGGGTLFLLLTWVLVGGLSGELDAQSRAGATEPLEIISGSRTHRFSVEIAETPEQRSRGLMFRRSMPADAGMLFTFVPPQQVAMWMRNTFIPLDMLFLNGQGKIIHIIERTVPFSEEILTHGLPVSGVLELNGGTVDRLDISAGDIVSHHAFR